MQELRNEYGGVGTGPGGTTERAWEKGELKTGQTSSETGSHTRRLRDEASQKLRSAREKASVAYDRTADQAVRAYHGARGYAQANPGVAAAASFATGLGIGMLLGIRSAARAYRRGFFPVVAFALAQAVRDVFQRAR
ncbi:MAG TPA: hypothetical protein VLL75_17965 [Vicinamibacteria bacterium]|nr:hypothetical protein [Vicinamibacteria bacterium]